LTFDGDVDAERTLEQAYELADRRFRPYGATRHDREDALQTAAEEIARQGFGDFALGRLGTAERYAKAIVWRANRRLKSHWRKTNRVAPTERETLASYVGAGFDRDPEAGLVEVCRMCAEEAAPEIGLQILGYSDSEIGHLLGVQANTIKLRRHRARARLRARLEEAS
jgi:DNA-directed RNA polymerase specialized sigma24 family protein